jgi:hypothetical protein
MRSRVLVVGFENVWDDEAKEVVLWEDKIKKTVRENLSDLVELIDLPFPSFAELWDDIYESSREHEDFFVALVNKHKPDVILLQIQIPVRSDRFLVGCLLGWRSKVKKRPKIIALSGLSRESQIGCYHRRGDFGAVWHFANEEDPSQIKKCLLDICDCREKVSQFVFPKDRG